MKLKVDRQTDALYLTLSDAPSSRSEEVSPGIVVDYDDQDRVVGIEMLHLSKRAPETDIQQQIASSDFVSLRVFTRRRAVSAQGCGSRVASLAGICQC